MAFERWEYTVEGEWSDPEKLEDRPGVYIIWCRAGENWSVLDVGESANVKSRVLNHDRSGSWRRNCQGDIYYSVIYTHDLQQAERMEIEQKIRRIENPPCGDR
jgi:hypothetical protein